jgi:mono/diheme cytochrome c family protein
LGRRGVHTKVMQSVNSVLSRSLVLSLAVSLVFVVFVALSEFVHADTKDEMAKALYAKGLELYLKNSCGVCHTLGKAETKGQFGPAHDGLGVVAAARIQDPNYTGKATTAEDYIRESILEPQTYLVPGYGVSRYKMPAFTNLSQEDVDALVYMLSQP